MMELWYIHRVGLSALLGWTNRVMRRPSKRGPGTELAPRFLCVCHNESLTDAVGAIVSQLEQQ